MVLKCVLLLQVVSKISTEGASAHLEREVATRIIPSHELATWLLSVVDKLLTFLGLECDKTIEEVVYTILVLGVSIIVGIVVEHIALFVVTKVVAVRHGEISRELLEQRIFKRCSHFIPPSVFLCLIPFAFKTDNHLLSLILRIGGIYLLITIGIAFIALLEFGWSHFQSHGNQKNHPLKGVLNICRGVVWGIISIVSISILVDKSPMTLLAGLGAFAAALMLVFKDSILGFVAGLQLSNNDMLRVGDWITVPSTIANGIVIDVTLTVVKVRNWDNTIVMLPPYSLVSTSFQNWRGMQEAGYRLINRTVYIDQASIREATDELIDDVVKKFPEIEGFVKECKVAKENGAEHLYNKTEPNGTIDSNLGLFRAYLGHYLVNHSLVATDRKLVVRLMDATDFGQPLNLYFYSKQTAWVPYMALASEIFEHVAVTASQFGLMLYNAPNRNRLVVEMRETKNS